MKKNLTSLLAALITCCLLNACQQNQPNEIILRPKMTPDHIQNTAAMMHTPSVPKDTALLPEQMPVKESGSAEKDEIKAENSQTPTPTPNATSAPTAQQREMNHYFAQRETKEVQTLFEHLYNDILAHKENITLPKNSQRERLERAMWLLMNDCPELFWFSHISELEYMENTPDIIESVTATYHMTEKEAEAASEKIGAMIDGWIGKTEGMTDYEKELYVHDMIVDNCRYASNSEYDGTIYGALLLGKARCEGYANALCYGLRCLGIPCAVVTGLATNAQGTESHAWNLIKIDGTWTWNDPTWNDPVGKDMRMYAYFNITNDQIEINHVVGEEYARYDLPVCSSMKQNYSVKNNCYVETDDDVKHALINWGVTYLRNEGTMISLRFGSAAQYESALGMLAECLQEAVNQTGVVPADGKFHYVTEPSANYLQFE